MRVLIQAQCTLHVRLAGMPTAASSGLLAQLPTTQRNATGMCTWGQGVHAVDHSHVTIICSTISKAGIGALRRPPVTSLLQVATNVASSNTGLVDQVCKEEQE